MGCALDQALRRLNFIQGDSFTGAGKADFGKVAKMAYDLERAASTLADGKNPPPILNYPKHALSRQAC